MGLVNIVLTSISLINRGFTNTTFFLFIWSFVIILFLRRLIIFRRFEIFIWRDAIRTNKCWSKIISLLKLDTFRWCWFVFRLSFNTLLDVCLRDIQALVECPFECLKCLQTILKKRKPLINLLLSIAQLVEPLHLRVFLGSLCKKECRQPDLHLITCGSSDFSIFYYFLHFESWRGIIEILSLTAYLKMIK